MGLAELVLLAIGLSMDAFAVSICKGLGMKKINLKVAVVLGLFFGGFQAGMPVIGWALGSQFMGIIGPIDHWIAFVLLAFIGIANVFSNTLGFIRQRKREFARYMSIGMTPEGMRKMFWIEALVIAGRPVLITLPITAVFVWLMITASYLNPMEFLAVAPIVPILLFIATLFGFVALAYYLGGKQILKCDLVEALRTDYMG